MNKKAKVTATVWIIDFGCFHKEQIEKRYPPWLRTQICDASRKLLYKPKDRRNAAFPKYVS